MSRRDKLILILVAGLPPSGSWQDLKDHMREAGDVCYADVYKDGTGVVEFMKYDDMKYAARKLDDSKFRSHEVCYCRSVEKFYCLQLCRCLQKRKIEVKVVPVVSDHVV